MEAETKGSKEGYTMKWGRFYHEQPKHFFALIPHQCSQCGGRFMWEKGYMQELKGYNSMPTKQDKRYLCAPCLVQKKLSPESMAQQEVAQLLAQGYGTTNVGTLHRPHK